MMKHGSRSSKLHGVKIICLWAPISAILTPGESASCEQRRGEVFGQPTPRRSDVASNSSLPRSPFDQFPRGKLSMQDWWIHNVTPHCPGGRGAFFSSMFPEDAVSQELVERKYSASHSWFAKPNCRGA